MKKKIGLIIGAILLISIITFSLIYTRPLTIEQRYPYLDISKCTEITGNYSDTMAVDDAQFVITSGDPRFGELIEIIQTAAFKTKLKNILPQGTIVHRYKDSDFRWDLLFYFEDVHLPDGSTSSGTILSIQDLYGDLSFSFNGEMFLCSVKNEEQWVKKIKDLIKQYIAVISEIV